MMFGLEVVLAAALFGPTQQPSKPASTSQTNVTTEFIPRDQTVLYEEIEVMRRLLARNLRGFAAGGDGMATTVYADSLWIDVSQSNRWLSTLPSAIGIAANSDAGMTGNPTSFRVPIVDQNLTTAQATPYYTAVWPSATSASVEGVYMHPVGVVFTLTLPAHGDPRPTTPKAAPAAISDWERIRKEIKGEKPDAAPASPSQPQSAGDIILKLLADNGKHFQHLGTDERLTVIVTFRGHPSHASKSASAAGQSPNASAGTMPIQNIFSSPDQMVGGTKVGSTSAALSSTRDLELLAELHLKQQQYEQALDAIRRAINQILDEVNKMRGAEVAVPSRQQARLHLNGLYNKQAQALLALGRTAEARDVLERAKRMYEELANATKPASQTAAKTSAVPLPAKLIVSAPKALLDAVGSGKIDFETFRKQVTIDYLTFGTDAEKKPKQ